MFNPVKEDLKKTSTARALCCHAVIRLEKMEDRGDDGKSPPQAFNRLFCAGCGERIGDYPINITLTRRRAIMAKPAPQGRSSESKKLVDRFKSGDLNKNRLSQTGKKKQRK